jgi:integrase
MRCNFKLDRVHITLVGSPRRLLKGLTKYMTQKRSVREDKTKHPIMVDKFQTRIYLDLNRKSDLLQDPLLRMTWNDVNLTERYLVLYSRKKRGGHFTPRKVPMPDKLYNILSHRYASQDKGKQWVFWHRHWDHKNSKWLEGPYLERKKIMRTLCKKAGVRYFRFHALRHFGASMLDHARVPISSIQRILGHENRGTTEIYLHSIGESEREAMKVFDREIDENSHTEKTKNLVEVAKSLI